MSITEYMCIKNITQDVTKPNEITIELSPGHGMINPAITFGRLLFLATLPEEHANARPHTQPDPHKL